MIAKLIKAIRITKLFGMYTYRLPMVGSFSDAAIFYGDNGLGKSTILRLAFHLLSTSNSRGHRTALYNSEFESLEVDLASDITLRAKFEIQNATKYLVLDIVSANKTLAIWEYCPRSESEKRIDSGSYYVEQIIDHEGRVTLRRKPRTRNNANIPRGDMAYLDALAKYTPTMFILNADRRLDSDAVADPSDEMELRRVMQYDVPKRINELVVRSREIALSQAMSAASNWISKNAVMGANKGTMNVHTVYVDVLRHLITQPQNKNEPHKDIDKLQLLNKLKEIESKTNKLAIYELTTPLSTSELEKAIGARSSIKRKLAADLLQPYIKSQESRLDALEPIYRTIDKFVSTVNTFLNDKRLIFMLSRGFSIQSKLDNNLSPAQLSSGEQQLLLLCCYVLTSRDQPSVFMIDEPEISLNIKWQRQLVQALLDITEGSTVQFIFASHSLELLAQHSTRVIKLVSQ